MEAWAVSRSIAPCTCALSKCAKARGPPSSSISKKGVAAPSACSVVVPQLEATLETEKRRDGGMVSKASLLSPSRSCSELSEGRRCFWGWCWC